MHKGQWVIDWGPWSVASWVYKNDAEISRAKFKSHNVGVV